MSDACAHTDKIGPFEMDGYADGVYQPTGLLWTVCRACGQTERVTEDSKPPPAPGATHS